MRARLFMRTRLFMRARLLASALLGGVACAAAGAAAAPNRPSPPCVLETFASGTVESVVDGRSFVLADGREVRLDGIEVPPAQEAALAALVLGRAVTLRHAKEATDRYGRILADAVIPGDQAAAPGSLAKTMLAQGLARISGRPGGAACMAELRPAEVAARAAKLGLWADPRYFPRQAEDAAGVAAERGRFTLVEGKVVSVRESGGTIYVNFGRRWSEDFTVTIPKRHERQFTAAGLEPRTLAGRHVMVRGWIEERGGPWIEASAPEQVEIVADK
jgi:endonuclease YncB( thermonuclease family)